MVQIGSDAHVREGTAISGGVMSWNQPRRPIFHNPTAYNTFIPQHNPEIYMGSAGVSNVMGRRRHYSGAGIVSLGTGGGGVIGSGRLGYGGTYSSSINTLNNLSASYPAPHMNPTLMRHYPSHHSSSYSSLPLMSAGSPTAGYMPTAGLLHGNSFLGNLGAATSLYRRYPSSATFLNSDIGWRR